MRRTSAVASVFAFIVAIAPGAAASCVETTARQDWRRADVIFVGTAEEGGDVGFTDFAVQAYMKGNGPHVVTVLTGQREPNVAGSNDLRIGNDERWVVYAYESPRWGLRSDFCTGSRPIRPGTALPSAERLGVPEGSIGRSGTDGDLGVATGPPLGLIGLAVIVAVPLLALAFVALRSRPSR